MRRGGLVVLGLVVVPVLAEAQGLGGLAFNARRRVYYQSAVREQTGLLVGGSGMMRLGPLEVGVGGWLGTLKGDGTALNPDAKARTTVASGLVQVVPGVMVGARYEVRRFESDVGVTVWTLMGAGVRVEPGLGAPGLRGLVEAVVLPSAAVQGGAALAAARQVTVGVSYAPPRSPLGLRLGYRVERYDVEAAPGVSARYEQFQGLVVEAGLRFGR